MYRMKQCKRRLLLRGYAINFGSYRASGTVRKKCEVLRFGFGFYFLFYLVSVVEKAVYWIWMKYKKKRKKEKEMVSRENRLEPYQKYTIGNEERVNIEYGRHCETQKMQMNLKNINMGKRLAVMCGQEGMGDMKPRCLEGEKWKTWLSATS